ncbi:MAG: DoxX family protein [Dehalococcoidia bacterium]
MGTPLRLVPLRLATGGTLAVHGFARLFGGPGTSERIPAEAYRYLGEEFREWMEGGGNENFTRQLEELGIPNARMAAYALAGTEFAGGVLFALGMFTPLAGLALGADLFASIRRVYWGHGMVGGGGWELPALLLTGVGTVLINQK